MFRYRPERWTEIRKGAFDAIRRIALEAGNEFPEETEDIIRKISGNYVRLSIDHVQLRTSEHRSMYSYVL